MKYYNWFSATLAVVEDSEDFPFTFESIEVQHEPIRHVVCNLGSGLFDGERKTLILMESDPRISIFVHANTDPAGKIRFLFDRNGQTVAIVWSRKFSCWFIESMPTCHILDDRDFELWKAHPERYANMIDH